MRREFQRTFLLFIRTFYTVGPTLIRVTVQPQSLFFNRVFGTMYSLKSIDNRFFLSRMAKYHIYTIADIVNRNGEFKWDKVKRKGLQEKDFLSWASIVHSLPYEWKQILKSSLISDHVSITTPVQTILRVGDKQIPTSDVNSKWLYRSLISGKFKSPTSQKNIIKRLGDPELIIDWKSVYSRIYTTSIDTYSRFFQYRILNNCLFLNYDLFCFNIVSSPGCCFVIHLLKQWITCFMSVLKQRISIFRYALGS